MPVTTIIGWFMCSGEDPPCRFVQKGNPGICGMCMRTNTLIEIQEFHPTKTCKCGCKQPVRFSKQQGRYLEFVKYHNRANVHNR